MNSSAVFDQIEKMGDLPSLPQTLLLYPEGSDRRQVLRRRPGGRHPQGPGADHAGAQGRQQRALPAAQPGADPHRPAGGDRHGLRGGAQAGAGTVGLRHDEQALAVALPGGHHPAFAGLRRLRPGAGRGQPARGARGGLRDRSGARHRQGRAAGVLAGAHGPGAAGSERRRPRAGGRAAPLRHHARPGRPPAGRPLEPAARTAERDRRPPRHRSAASAARSGPAAGGDRLRQCHQPLHAARRTASRPSRQSAAPPPVRSGSPPRAWRRSTCARSPRSPTWRPASARRGRPHGLRPGGEPRRQRHRGAEHDPPAELARRTAAQLELYRQVGQGLADGEDGTRLLGAILDGAVDILGFERVVLLEVDQQSRGWCRPCAPAKGRGTGDPSGLPGRARTGALALAVLEHRTFHVPDAASAAYEGMVGEELLAAARCTGFAVAPLSTPGGRAGRALRRCRPRRRRHRGRAGERAGRAGHAGGAGAEPAPGDADR